MADRRVSDQPTILTISQLREMAEELPAHSQDGPLGMLAELEGKGKGTEMLVPLEDDSRVPYVWDGEMYLHRGDLKPAKVLRAEGERLAAAAQKRAGHG
jgi:hypothetical protein